VSTKGEKGGPFFLQRSSESLKILFKKWHLKYDD